MKGPMPLDQAVKQHMSWTHGCAGNNCCVRQMLQVRAVPCEEPDTAMPAAMCMQTPTSVSENT